MATLPALLALGGAGPDMGWEAKRQKDWRGATQSRRGNAGKNLTRFTGEAQQLRPAAWNGYW